MGQPHAVRKVPRSGGQQDGDAEAVTPVIGAVLILGISVLGIAGVLFWGAPTIDRIQAGNAQTAVIGEFEDLRDSSRELSVPDHSRFPTVVLPRGDLGVGEGSRIAITSIRQGAGAGCNFQVTGWADGGAAVGTTGCTFTGTPLVYEVSGQSLIAAANAAAIEEEGDWLVRLVNGATTVAEAWIITGDRVEWTLDAAGGRAVYLDSGAIFSDTAGSMFLEKAPPIGDVAFGSNYYGLWLRSLAAGLYGGIGGQGGYQLVSGQGSYQLYLSLVGNYIRTDATAVQSVRYDIAGDLAESWCNALLARNRDLPTGSQYAEVAGFECDDSLDPDDVRAVRYTCTTDVPAPVTDDCAGNANTFTFRFLHARILANLAP